LTDPEPESPVVQRRRHVPALAAYAFAVGIVLWPAVRHFRTRYLWQRQVPVVYDEGDPCCAEVGGPEDRGVGVPGLVLEGQDLAVERITGETLEASSRVAGGGLLRIPGRDGVS